MATLRIFDDPFDRQDGTFVYGWHPETEERCAGPCIFYWIKRALPEKDGFTVILKNLNRKYMDACWAELKAGAALDEIATISIEDFI